MLGEERELFSPNRDFHNEADYSGTVRYQIMYYSNLYDYKKVKLEID